MPDAAFFRPHTDPVENLAVDFIEQELGRLDFHKNWQVFKRKFPGPADQQKRVQDWLDRLGIQAQATPQQILDHIEKLSTHDGLWL